MKRNNLLHLLIWTLLITIEVLAYLPFWGTSFWIATIINLSLLVGLFYLCRHFTKRYIKNYKQQPFFKSKELMYIISAGVLFLITRLIIDFIILKTAAGSALWIYGLALIRLALAYMIPAFFVAGYETRKQAAAILSRKQAQIEEENRLLLMEQNELSREVTLLKVELIAAHEQLDVVGRKYIAKLKEYREMIRRMREDGDEWKDGLN